MRKRYKTIITALLFALPLFLMAGMPVYSQVLGGAGTNNTMVDYLDLRSVPLNEALRLLSEESGFNFVATEAAAAKTATPRASLPSVSVYVG